jgi:putative chitinase
MTDFASALTKLWPNGDQKCPGLRAGIIASAPAVFAKYGVKDSLVLAHLMAQISHECGAGHDIVENLNYKAERMTEVWPSRFKTVADAVPYAGNPKALANKVYNGRMGNRLGSDDGWNFRGRGGSQTTGREGYERVKKQTGLDVVSNPDILIDPKHFLECSVSDFINCGCMPYAKMDDLGAVSAALNVGDPRKVNKVVGLPERRDWLTKWKAAAVTVPVGPIIILPPGPTPPDVPKPSQPSVTNPSPGSIGAFIAAIFAAIFKRK